MNRFTQLWRSKHSFPPGVNLTLAFLVVIIFTAYSLDWERNYFQQRIIRVPYFWRQNEPSPLKNGIKLIKYQAGNNSIYDRPNSERIYFHENDWQGRLNERQSCAVESAALHNPGRPVQLFMQATDSFDYSSRWFNVLSHYNNVDIVIIDEKEYAKGTPMEDWWKEKRWRASPHWPVHLTDLFRMTSLYKGGGMYLDLDYITLKPFGDLRNFFVMEMETAKAICSSVFHLDMTHRLANEFLNNITRDYDPENWGFAGGPKITQMMQAHCAFEPYRKPVRNTCDDINLLPYWTFLPIVPNHYHLIFRTATNYSMSLLYGAYGFHYWNSKSKYEYVDMSSDMLFAVIAREHCPLTAQEAMKIDYFYY